MGDESVAICMVTHNSADDLAACMTSLAAVVYGPLELIVVDCASSDQSVSVVQRTAPEGMPLTLRALEENLGFAGGMEVALSLTQAPLILTLNPDCRPEPEFVSSLVARLTGHPQVRVGAVAGRLYRPLEEGAPVTLDACGMYLTPTWRHFDRASGQEDELQWELSDRVFGATGAASLFSRRALADVAVNGEVFLWEFHSYREDAELCFRLQERGWEVLYEPAALCEHRRTNLPRRRSSMHPQVNMHSLKNRYLLRFYHQDWLNFVLTAVPTLLRDLGAFAYVLLRERTSLAAYSWLWTNRNMIIQRRRSIQGRRTSGSWTVNRWFFSRSQSL